ncbi:hypothetical protein LUZ61_005172 [Rhynchospora tenuis]|uniref:MADS-box transcription factor n=1 Tax=Rhynchospora tenuis TaxID=198213 RepID=A0AAD5ZP65_9POAL|nr:hypothetical protein LUZ61_005172 [Rhynchospora tenuis]
MTSIPSLASLSLEVDRSTEKDQQREREPTKMGRGRVELKRIENKINRQVTFAKRRNGLLKKAYELAVLCDAEVGLIIFSHRGKLYEFSSTQCMTKTLERYQKNSYNAPEPAKVISRETLNSQQEYFKLKSHVEHLQFVQRNLMGEDLGSLTIDELIKLESQLDSSLKQIRDTRTQTFLDTLDELKRSDVRLCEANRKIKKRLTDLHGEEPQLWEGNNSQGIGYIKTDQVFFAPIECEPTLQIGYQNEQQMAIATTSAGPSMTTLMPPGWLA